MSTAPAFWLVPPPETGARVAPLAAVRRLLPTFPSPPLRVSRVGQLDAALLDHELEGILGGPFWKALEGLRKPGRRSWEPEMMALLRVTILKMSLFERGATYGASLQNLKYRNEWLHSDGLQSTAIDSTLTPLQLNAYTVLTVLPSYLHTRLQDRMLTSSWSDEPLPPSWLSLLDLRRLFRRRRNLPPGVATLSSNWKRVVFELIRLGEKLGQIAGLANFLVFLYDGRYRTLVDRVLGMRLIYNQRAVNRNVSFEFLNRQLVWEAFTEFLLFLMPLVNLHRLRLRALRILSATTTKSKALSSVLTVLPLPLLKALGLPSRASPVPSTSATKLEDERDLKIRPQGTFGFLPATTCPVCYAESTSASGAALPPTSLPSSSLSSIARSGVAPAAATVAVSTGGEDVRVKVPYVANCGWSCRYCYYCVVGKLVTAEEEGLAHWDCMRCGLAVNGVSREVEVGDVEDGELRDMAGSDLVDDAADRTSETDAEDERESVGSQHDNWR